MALELLDFVKKNNLSDNFEIAWISFAKGEKAMQVAETINDVYVSDTEKISTHYINFNDSVPITPMSKIHHALEGQLLGDSYTSTT